MSRTLAVLLAAVSLHTAAGASINKHHMPDSTSQDGRALNGIIWEADETRRIEYLEYFHKQYPHSEWRASAYALLQDLYLRRNQPDKAIEAGDKMLALDPDDLEAACKNQQIAASKSDAAVARKYSDLSYAIALRLSRIEHVPDNDGGEMRDRIELAKSTLASFEYDLYTQAIQTADPHKKIEMLNQLLRADPQTQYLDNANLALFAAYRQLDENARAVQIAERLTSGPQFYPDMLLFLAGDRLQRQKNPAAAAAECERLLRDIEAGHPPEDFNKSQWAEKKVVFLSQARLLQFYAYKQANEPAKAAAAAEAILAEPDAPPDVILYAADYYFRVDRNVKKVQQYSEQLLRTIGEDRKPAGIADNDWMRQKDIYTEVACYMIGSLQMQAGNYTAAGETLRQAWQIARRTEYLLPAITAVLAATAQHLEKYSEAAQLYKQSMEFGPGYRAEAVKKLAALKNEHGIE